MPLNKPKNAFIPVEVLNSTLTGYEQNVLIQNLLSNIQFPFKVQDVEKVVSLYYLGTEQNGTATFPFIDRHNNITAIQTIQYTDLIHSCLFGEHLLSKYPSNPVALAETPETAVYGTLYFGFPEQPTNFLWLSVSNWNSLNLNKCSVLTGRSICLFPGKDFELWRDRANEIQELLPGTCFQVSALDIAITLIKQDWRLFRGEQDATNTPCADPTQRTPTSSTFFTPLNSVNFSDTSTVNRTSDPTYTTPPTYTAQDVWTQDVQRDDWSRDIAELETYFTGADLPTQPIKINVVGTITNCPLFIDGHLTFVKANNGNRSYLPYLNRLRELKEYLQTTGRGESHH